MSTGPLDQNRSRSNSVTTSAPTHVEQPQAASWSSRGVKKAHGSSSKLSDHMSLSLQKSKSLTDYLVKATGATKVFLYVFTLAAKSYVRSKAHRAAVAAYADTKPDEQARHLSDLNHYSELLGNEMVTMPDGQTESLFSLEERALMLYIKGTVSGLEQTDDTASLKVQRESLQQLMAGLSLLQTENKLPSTSNVELKKEVEELVNSHLTRIEILVNPHSVMTVEEKNRELFSEAQAVLNNMGRVASIDERVGCLKLSLDTLDHLDGSDGSKESAELMKSFNKSFLTKLAELFDQAVNDEGIGLEAMVDLKALIEEVYSGQGMPPPGDYKKFLVKLSEKYTAIVPLTLKHCESARQALDTKLGIGDMMSLRFRQVEVDLESGAVLCKMGDWAKGLEVMEKAISSRGWLSGECMKYVELCMNSDVKIPKPVDLPVDGVIWDRGLKALMDKRGSMVPDESSRLEDFIDPPHIEVKRK
ncbi:hypothetical protein EOPP23_00860 [Endozoicomonas sp. OPT23]|uniref:hypothetical protein n=1 Tax=Endozoicomonas sp. OPT23 TaxID=2072845 RepID=UPI00129AAA4A|nr:hypothetical protein [Endozoicomonas sp. OPT23]MRI31541.1 hypothetical protein [Endozoicomonas sp. OPT23]